jgi:hypothetical protein
MLSQLGTWACIWLLLHTVKEPRCLTCFWLVTEHFSDHITLQLCDILYLMTQSATLCGMWPWDPITYEKWTTLLFDSLYPKVVVTMRLVYLRLAWPVPLCLHKPCKVVYKGLRDGLTFPPFSALLRISSILSELIICIVWAFLPISASKTSGCKP